MIKATARSAPEREITNWVRKAKFNNDLFAHEFGIAINSTMTEYTTHQSFYMEGGYQFILHFGWEKQGLLHLWTLNMQGTSSLKRRQYLERRTHLFHISSSDMGLLDHFNLCPDIPLEVREMIGDGKNQVRLFSGRAHMAVRRFLSRVFVAARRHLPQFDYAAFINEAAYTASQRCPFCKPILPIWKKMFLYL